MQYVIYAMHCIGAAAHLCKRVLRTSSSHDTQLLMLVLSGSSSFRRELLLTKGEELPATFPACLEPLLPAILELFALRV